MIHTSEKMSEVKGRGTFNFALVISVVFSHKFRPGIGL